MPQTIIGIFENSIEAQRAKQALLESGFNADSIEVNDHIDTVDDLVTDGQMTDTTDSDSFSPAQTIKADEERAGSIVTVRAEDAGEVLIATEILNDLGAIDVNEFSQS